MHQGALDFYSKIPVDSENPFFNCLSLNNIEDRLFETINSVEDDFTII